MADFKYKRTAEQLLEKIKDGTYKEGERIPTETELCEFLQIGRQTLRKAVSTLEQEGYLRRIQGSGTYVQGPSRQQEAGSGNGSLRQSKTVTLLMMNNNNYVFLSIMRGISDYLARQGYILSTIITDGDYEKERLILENLLLDPPAGLIYEPTCSAIRSINYQLYRRVAAQVPTLLLHTSRTKRALSLSLRDEIGTKKATDYLISLGHQRIGSIYVMDEMTGQNRYVGYMQSLREHHLAHHAEDSIWVEHDKKGNIFQSGGCLPLENMLKNVTAILCHDDRMAGTLIWYLKDKGLRVPEDISVIGYDDSEYATMELPLTTVTHPKEEYGRMAALALLEIMRSGSDVDITEFEIEPELVIRESTGPVSVKPLSEVV